MILGEEGPSDKVFHGGKLCNIVDISTVKSTHSSRIMTIEERGKMPLFRSYHPESLTTIE